MSFQTSKTVLCFKKEIMKNILTVFIHLVALDTINEGLMKAFQSLRFVNTMLWTTVTRMSNNAFLCEEKS